MVKGSGTRANVTKVVLDQTIFAPVILTAFFTAMPVLEGQSLETGLDNAKSHLIPALKLNYFVWPAAQAINFRYVPLQHRVGYVSVILCFWNAVISYLHHKPHDETDANVTKAIE
jgi:protein Mpv17